MDCRWCGSTNRGTARFCAVCAAPLLDGVPLGTWRTGECLHTRYQLRKLLGAGAMGTVYGALDNNVPGRRVAIKELDPQRISNPPDRQPAAEMFAQEAQTLARLDHPGVIKISDYFGEGQRQYQVMDFVDGLTLEEILRQRRVLPEHQVVDWSRQLCDALHYLHTQTPPVIFRDLKPGNIMVDRSGRVKLIDFGIARRFKGGKSKDTQIMGTPGFAPPEQHGSGQTDARSDIYALCATMYVLLTGYDVSATPFQFPPIRSLMPTITPQTEQVVMHGLELNPNNRWQTVQQLAGYWLGLPLTPGGTGPVSVLGRRGTPTSASTKPFSRPTQRLGAMLASLSNAQLALALLGVAVLAFSGTALLTPVLVMYPLFWNNFDMSAIIGPLAFAGVRRRGVAGIAQLVIASVGGITIQMQLNYPASASISAIVLAFASAVFIEFWLLLLPKIKEGATDGWQREVAWLALMAIVATYIVRIPFLPAYGVQLGSAIGSAILGGLGWFLGDLVQQYLFFKQQGYKRAGHV